MKITRDAVPSIPADQWAELVKQLRLSPQQARIVRLILQDYCDKEIATEMHLKVPTVRTYIGRLFLRLRVDSRSALILMIFSHCMARRGEISHHQR